MEILRATNEKVLKIVVGFQARLGLKIFRILDGMVNHINPFLTYLLMFILNTMKEMMEI